MGKDKERFVPVMTKQEREEMLSLQEQGELHRPVLPLSVGHTGEEPAASRYVERFVRCLGLSFAADGYPCGYGT